MIYNEEYRGIIIGNSWKADNKLAFSKLGDFARSAETAANIIGIRYVIKGCENYTLNRKTHNVKDGSFLLINPDQKFDTVLDNGQEPTTGLCINLDKELLKEVYNNFCSSHSSLLEHNPMSNADIDFLQTIYKPSDHFSQYLASLKKHLNENTGELMIEKEELFYSVAENLLISQSIINKQASQIKANKAETRKELFKRVNEAKSMMDDSTMKSLEIADLAAAVALSEFHFFRIFKQVYGITPNQYQINQRLNRAKQQVEKGSLSITEIAEINGFADIYTFSKAFKKAFLISPNQLKQLKF